MKRKSVGKLRGSLIPLLVALATGAALAPGAIAQTVPFDETRPLRPDAAVSLRVVTHTLVVAPWDRAEIRISGEYEAAWEALEITGTEASVRFEIRQEEWRDQPARAGSERILVQVPTGVRLTASTVSGSVEITGLNGVVTAHGVSGSITVEGDLDEASLETVSGAVRYSGNASTVRLTAVSGAVSFRGSADRASLRSVSGAIAMEGAAESLDASSVSGRVSVTSARPVRALELASVSGAVSFTGTVAAGGTLNAESHSGAVDLTLGEETDAHFELSTFSGRIDATFPGARDEVRIGSRMTPTESLSFVSGTGAGRIEVRSFSGRVTIRARAGGPP